MVETTEQRMAGTWSKHVSKSDIGPTSVLDAQSLLATTFSDTWGGGIIDKGGRGSISLRDFLIHEPLFWDMLASAASADDTAATTIPPPPVPLQGASLGSVSAPSLPRDSTRRRKRRKIRSRAAIQSASQRVPTSTCPTPPMVAD
eukprot:gene3774-biopygen3801